MKRWSAVRLYIPAVVFMIGLCLATYSPSAGNTLGRDSIVLENRKITAREFADVVQSGKTVFLRHDTITSDWIVGGINRPKVASIYVQNSVFEQNLIIGEIEVVERASISFDNCHFKKGVHFGLCSFMPWSNLILTNCRHDGLLTFDKCELKPLTEVLIDSARLGNGVMISECNGEWLFRLMNSRIHNGCVIQGSAWECAFTKCDFLPGGFVKGDFGRTTLSDCTFWGTDFELTTLPPDQSMGRCTGIDKLSFKDSPSGLSALRNWYRLNGYRQKEREVTFALRKTENRLAAQPVKFIQWLLFDFTCAWGMDYLRPLLLALALLFLLWPIYWGFATAHRNGDIERLWIERRRGRLDVPYAITIHRLRPFARRKTLLLARLTLLFSIMSAFNIGFREFNFGRWIRSITKNEYDLKATGWARTVSGLQALISVFLFVLFLLTYFGRPFD